MYAKPCKIFQQVKNRMTLYVYLPPKIIVELKPQDFVHVDLIGPYSKSIRQHCPGGATINNFNSITCMTMIEPSMG